MSSLLGIVWFVVHFISSFSNPVPGWLMQMHPNLLGLTLDGLNHMSTWISSGDILGCLRGGVEEEEVSILEPQAGRGAKMYIKINQPKPKDGGFGQEAPQRKVAVACHVIEASPFLARCYRLVRTLNLVPPNTSKYIRLQNLDFFKKYTLTS